MAVTAKRDMKNLTVRVTDEQHMFVKNAAEKRGESVNEFLTWLLFDLYPKYVDGYVESSDIMVNRLNQVAEGLANLTSNVNNLSQITSNGFTSLLGLTRGDNYLLTEDDGELPQ